MTWHQIEIVRESWSSVAALDPGYVGRLFYNRLFAIAPEVRPVIGGDIGEQPQKLLSTLHFVIRRLDRMEEIVDRMTRLAFRNARYGTCAEHYNVIGSALLWTLEQGLGAGWNEELEAAWAACYTVLSGAMMAASAEAVAA